MISCGIGSSLYNARPGHPFAQAAFCQERTLQFAQLSIEQVTRYLYQTNDHVGRYAGILMLNSLAKGFVVGPWLSIEFSKPFGVGVLPGPLHQAVRAQKIAIIFKQFLQTRAGHVRELDLCFL